MHKKLLPLPVLLLLAGTPAQAAVTFQFNFNDSVGVGFNDLTSGAARKNELISAGNYLSSFLTQYNANIVLDVDGSHTDPGYLASAGQNYYTAFAPGFSNYGDVQKKILFGNAADPNPFAVDGEVNWNFHNFQWGYGDTVQSDEFDFFSTAVHELAHALGYASLIRQNGYDYPLPGNPPGTPGNWAPFDRWLAGSSGLIIDPSTYELDGARWNAASVGGAGASGLLFVGPNAMVANGGNPLYLYSPITWEGGSSGSHLDDQFYSSLYVMEAATGTGPGLRTFSAVEIGMFRDLGYTNFGVSAPIPEPETYALMLVGLGLVGMMARRRARA